MGNVLFTQEMAVPDVLQDIQRVATTPYVKDYATERKKALIDLLIVREGDQGVKVLRFTQSLCPGCVEEEKWDKMKIDSVVFVKHDRVWQLKECAEHGIVKSLYYADYAMYKKAESFQDPGIKILNPHIDKSQFEIDCPNDCGLCVEHESHTGLGNIVLTNRCDLTCWYCLPFDEELPVRIAGKTKTMKIGEIVENNMAAPTPVPKNKGVFSVPANPIDVLTFVDGKATWRRVTKLFRRPYKGKFVRLTTQSGKRIITTADHRFATITNRFQKKTVDNIGAANLLTIDAASHFPVTYHTPHFNDSWNTTHDTLYSVFSFQPATDEFPAAVQRINPANTIGDFSLDSAATIETFDGPEQNVYDLEVDSPSHTFIAGDGILISNCFFYAKEGEPIYEPTMDQIKFMLKRMKNVKPIGANAVQLTGGEPTLRDDICDIVRAAKEIGYDHVQLNTNGIRLSQDPQLSLNLRDAGVNNLYMSFDGMSPQTNPKNYWEAQQAIENCRKAGIGVVLVPTVIGGINDHELGDIIRFGAGHLGVVRSVNFQPVSLVGRMPDKLRMEQRITIPGAIKRIEEQTDGQIGKEAWFPVPCARQITDFIEALKEEPKYRLSIHFACGSATYVFKNENGKLVPITDFFDIEGFFNYLGELTGELKGARIRKLAKAQVLAKLALNIRKFIDNEYKPKNLNLIKMLTGAMTGGNYHGLADFHYNSLFVGMMHFQDPYNWDLDRIHKCDIHYATPDGRVIPFCTFNVIPELYRDKIQRKFSIPAAEWEVKTGKKIADVYHRRVLTDAQKKDIIGYFNNFRKDPFSPKPKIEPDWGYEAIKAAAQAIVAPAAPAADLISLDQITGSTKFGAAKRPTMSHPAGAAGCGTSGGCS